MRVGSAVAAVLSWQISGEWAYDADLWTELEVTFTPEGPDRTRVELEHRGLDAYGDKAERDARPVRLARGVAERSSSTPPRPVA